MEPDNLNPPPPSNDTRLEAWLRTNTALPPLPDDGFSRRVLAALPAPQRTPGVSPRLCAIAAGATLGIGFAALKLFTAAPDEFSLPVLGPEAADAFEHLTDPKLHVALGVTVLTLGFAFWRKLRQLMSL